MTEEELTAIKRLANVVIRSALLSSPMTYSPTTHRISVGPFANEYAARDYVEALNGAVEVAFRIHAYFGAAQ